MGSLEDEIVQELFLMLKGLEAEQTDNSVEMPAEVSVRLLNIKNLLSDFQSFLKTDLFDSGNKILGNHLFSLILKYLKEAKFLSGKIKKKNKRLEFDLAISKLKVLVHLLPFTFRIPKDDFECLDDSHPRKVAVAKVTNIVQSDQSIISKQIAAFIIKYNALKAVFYRMCKYKSSKSRNLLSGSLFLYYSLFSKPRRKSVIKCDLHGNIEPYFQLWNVTESPLIKKFLPVVFPSISYNKMIYLPRLFPKITEPFHKSSESQEHYIDLISQEPLLAGASYSFRPDPAGLRVPVRILSPFPLHKVQHEEYREQDSCFSAQHDSKKLEKIIIHIHGGGYLGQTSFTHQNYTREWAKQLQEPVFCIDYRLAPMNPFPDGLDDAWQAYTWIVKYAHKYLGIVPHKIVIAGDSAGGNYAIGIAIKAKSCGFRPPDGLLLVYPAVNIDLEYPALSSMLALEDPILSYRGLLGIVQSYVTKEQHKDCFVSPIYAKDETLAGFPRCKILVAENDPLRSDCLRFVDKLLRNGVDVEVFRYEGFIHGAMNLGHFNGIPAFERVVGESIEILRSLVN